MKNLAVLCGFRASVPTKDAPMIGVLPPKVSVLLSGVGQERSRKPSRRDSHRQTSQQSTSFPSTTDPPLPSPNSVILSGARNERSRRTFRPAAANRGGPSHRRSLHDHLPPMNLGPSLNSWFLISDLRQKSADFADFADNQQRDHSGGLSFLPSAEICGNLRTVAVFCRKSILPGSADPTRCSEPVRAPCPIRSCTPAPIGQSPDRSLSRRAYSTRAPFPG